MKQDRDADTGVSDDRAATKHLRCFERPGKLKSLGIKFAIGTSTLIGGMAAKEGCDSHIYPPDRPLVWKDLTWVERNAITHEAEQQHKHWDQYSPGTPRPSLDAIKEKILESPQDLPDIVKRAKEYPFSVEWVEDMYGHGQNSR